ncbi:MAG: hypothetical protein ACJ72N_28205 [Labedaea sp.]
MFRFSTLALAAVMSAPSMWQAFVAESLDPTSALLRFLIAVPLAAVMLALPRAVVRHYRRHRPQQTSVQAEAVRRDGVQVS